MKSMNIVTSFGDVSKILSHMWVNLSAKEKKAYRSKISKNCTSNGAKQKTCQSKKAESFLNLFDFECLNLNSN